MKDWHTGRRNIIAAILPMIVFSVLYEILFLLLDTLRQTAGLHAGGTVFAYLTGYEADIRALITALSMSAAFLPLMPTAKAEIRGFESGYKTGSSSQPQPSAGGSARRTGSSGIVLAAGVLGISAGMNILISLMGIPVSGSSASDPMNASLMMASVTYGLLTPLLEESVFRGITFRRFITYTGISVPASAVISSALFGFYHGNPAQMIYAFVMGCLFCAAYHKTGMFLYPCLLHASCNLVSLFLSYTGLFEAICSPVWCIAAFSGGVLMLYCAFRTGNRRNVFGNRF